MCSSCRFYSLRYDAGMHDSGISKVGVQGGNILIQVGGADIQVVGAIQIKDGGHVAIGFVTRKED